MARPSHCLSTPTFLLLPHLPLLFLPPLPSRTTLLRDFNPPHRTRYEFNLDFGLTLSSFPILSTSLFSRVPSCWWVDLTFFRFCGFPFHFQVGLEDLTRFFGFIWLCFDFLPLFDHGFAGRVFPCLGIGIIAFLKLNSLQLALLDLLINLGALGNCCLRFFFLTFNPPSTKLLCILNSNYP